MNQPLRGAAAAGARDARSAAPVGTVYIAGGDVASIVPGGSLPALEEGPLAVRPLPDVHDAGALRVALRRAEPAPAAIVLTPGVDDAIAAGRRIHRLAPLLHLVFVLRPERLEAFREATAVAPRLGDHWSLVAAGDEHLVETVRAAARDTLKRTRVRAQYDRMNAKMRRRIVLDSEAHRGLVISNQYLASILEHASDAIIALDQEGTIATWNEGAREMYGIERSEALGQHVRILVEDAQAPELIACVRAAQSGEVLRNRELECRRADGARFHAEFTFAPVRDDSDRPTSVSVTARDVSERRRHAAEVAALNRTLEHRVTELRHANASLVAALTELEATKRELELLNATLERQATTDALTGLKNRMVFRNSLLEAIAVAERQGTQLALLMVDVDHFKRINDTLGHQQGDRVLQSIAASLTENTRDQDIVARYGGEEFAVLLPNASQGEAIIVAEKLRRGCAESGSAAGDDAPEGACSSGQGSGAGAGAAAVRVTVSVGVAVFRMGDTDDTLLGRADEALYASKARGRNCVTVAAAGMEPMALEG